MTDFTIRRERNIYSSVFNPITRKGLKAIMTRSCTTDGEILAIC